MSYDKIAGLVDSIAKILDDSEKIVLPTFAVKVRKVAEIHPDDHTLVAIANILSKYETNNKLFITKGDLKNLYNKSYTTGTRFAEYFRDELGEINNLTKPKVASKQEVGTIDIHSAADPVLANALTSVFDKNVPLKLYSKDTAKQAVVSVGSNLDAWNLKASNLSIDAGNERFMVVKADYDTPKGLTSILVPVEVVKNRVVDSVVFMGNFGPQEINHTNIKAYITSNAGAKLNVSSKDVISALTNVVAENKEISSVSLALTKMNAEKETHMPFFGDAVLGQEIQAASKNDIVLPKLGEFNSFAEKLESPLGFANFKFGVAKVNLGRDVVLNALANVGVKNVQVNVADADNDTIMYAVSSTNKHLAFNVPVKFANNRVVNPDAIVCNESVLPLSKKTINKLLADNAQDHKAAAITSPLYGLKPSDLIESVRQAMSEGNYAKAEDALNILLESGNDKAYKAAFSIYTAGLSIKKSASAETTCSMIVKSSSSEHPICGHTGLPLHKVYQDQHGNCLPLYRKAMSENYDNVQFINSKIFG